jgi:hypothetical protein
MSLFKFEKGAVAVSLLIHHLPCLLFWILIGKSAVDVRLKVLIK